MILQDKPKISVISPSKNTGRFAKETIELILSQTYTNWEHIIIDGVSSDETLEVIKKYPHIRLISEKDSGPTEAFRKGLAMANGEYIMFCCISDGYLDKNWFKKTSTILDNYPELSLVWGLPQYMSEEGTLGHIAYDHFFDEHPPQRTDFLYYWLKTHFFFPEGNFCIRKNVLDNCFPIFDIRKIDERHEFLTFNYNFNTQGYLPYFIPVVANYGRIHHDAGGQRQIANGQMRLWLKKYHDDIRKYTQQLIKNNAVHTFRDGYGKPLSKLFDPNKYKNIKIKYPGYKKTLLQRAIGVIKNVLS